MKWTGEQTNKWSQIARSYERTYLLKFSKTFLALICMSPVATWMWCMLHCVSKKYPRHFRLQLDKRLSDFNTSRRDIPNTTGHQMIVQFPTSPNVCFCTTWGKWSNEILHFYLTQYYYLIKITYKTYFVHIYITLADSSYNNPRFNGLQ